MGSDDSFSDIEMSDAEAPRKTTSSRAKKPVKYIEEDDDSDF